MKNEGNKIYNTYTDKSKYKKIKLQSLLKKTLLVLILILVGNFLVAKIFNYNFLEDIGKKVLNLAGIYTEPIPQVSFESEGWSSDTPGSWHVDKSAKWTDFGKAKVTFDLNSVIKTEDNYKDIVLVLDISGSMSGDKLERVKKDATELTEYVLSNPENRMALISFDSESAILSYLTNKKEEILDEINNLKDEGSTNYNAGLKNVLTVLDGYEHKDDRDLVVLFLTDGFPNEEVPNQIAEYHILKDNYPYLTINGVQYEMGTEIQQDIINISDNQFYADMETLNNVLFDASVAPVVYENFEIVDYIEDEYFYVNDVKDIKVTVGTVKLEGSKGEKQKITWSLGDSFKTGGTAKMEINLTLKEEYEHENDLYPTNDSESFKSKLPDEDEETKESTLTPVLKNSYEVEYDVNLPKEAECNLDKYNKKVDHYVFENVNYATEGESLTCNGYIFKGWEIDDKETDGRSIDIQRVNDEVFVMPEHDVVVRGIWSKPVISKAMDGTIHEKLTLYKEIEKEAKSGSGFAAEYTEGKADDSYTNPDANEKIYYYRGTAPNNNVIFGGFCWQMVRTTATGGVKMMYNGLPSETGECNAEGTGRQIEIIKEDGTLKSEPTQAFNSMPGSLASVGYMYNKEVGEKYEFKNRSIDDDLEVLTRLYTSGSTNYYYATSINYNGTQYELGSDAEQLTWSNLYSNSHGYYTCHSTETTCNTIYYIAGGASSYAYVIELTNGNLLEQVDSGMYIGTNYTESDGTYTITNPKLVKKQDWYKNYNSYSGMYMCGNGLSTSCNVSDLNYLVATSNWYITIAKSNIKFGNSFNYDGTNYTITDAKTYAELGGDIGKHHYTCLNESGICSSVSYIYFAVFPDIYMINLEKGKDISDSLDEMLLEGDVNKDDSDIKIVIDRWYEKYLKGTQSEKYLEDFIFCNDRLIGTLGGWDPEEEDLNTLLAFNTYVNFYFDRISLTCANETDKFSISNNKAKLKYPIGLLTGDESNLLREGSLKMLTTGERYWLGSPLSFAVGNSTNCYIDAVGDVDNNPVSYNLGVRPVISLRPNVEYSDGDGTSQRPFTIEVE